jgi:hypothetical protein
MRRLYTPYIPQTTGEVYDLLGSMMLSSPKFIDKTGYFPDRNIDTEFFALKEGLNNVRKKLGEERYLAAIDMADRMRVHFEADPEDKTDDGLAGRQLIIDIEDLLKASNDRKR